MPTNDIQHVSVPTALEWGAGLDRLGARESVKVESERLVAEGARALSGKKIQWITHEGHLAGVDLGLQSTEDGTPREGASFSDLFGSVFGSQPPLPAAEEHQAVNLHPELPKTPKAHWALRRLKGMSLSGQRSGSQRYAGRTFLTALARLIPAPQRDRYAEEWQSEWIDIGNRPLLSRMAYLARLASSSPLIVWEVWRKHVKAV